MSDSSTIDYKSQPNAEGTVTEPPRSAEAALKAIDLLISHKRQLGRLTIAALVVFTVIAFLIPKRYEAVARLMPPDQSNSASAMLGALTAKGGDVIGAAAGDALGLRTSGATVVGVLNSRTVQDDLINQFDLRKVYSERRYDDARKVLQQRTDIAEDKKSGIIMISVQDRDAQRSARLARGYIDNLNVRIAQLSTSAARREREFLEARLLSIKQQLDESTLQLSKFSSRNMTFDPQIQGKAMIEAASTLQGQLIAAETEISGLDQVYGPENSRVKAASARVGELRSKLRSMSGAGDTKGSSNGQLGPSLEQLPLLGNTYYDLARQAKINETVYEVLTRQYELAKVQEAKEVPSIRVLDEPVVPERKVWPPRLIIILLGTLMTLLFGILWYLGAAVVAGLDPDDPRRVLLHRMKQLGAGIFDRRSTPYSA
jgi:capsule polysaccharide export protein KpsE/RkpR